VAFSGNKEFIALIAKYASVWAQEPVVRCSVCEKITAVYSKDDAGRPVCLRHNGAGCQEALDTDAMILFEYFPPDMRNPQ
jgi:hypothetical protein